MKDITNSGRVRQTATSFYHAWKAMWKMHKEPIALLLYKKKIFNRIQMRLGMMTKNEW